MKFFFFFVLLFGLPHSDWIPLKLGLDESSIPLGIMNWLLLVALFLWVLGRISGRNRKNPFKAYRYFIAVLLFGVGLAIINGFGQNTMDILTLSKREISLLFLYFVPLSFIKNQRDFIICFSIIFVVNFLIGYEVLQSGMLAGIHFNDAKRGAGPFGFGWRGSDIAGAYLAQVLMFFVAIIMVPGPKVWIKGAAGVALIPVFAGILATYGRGAILASFLGVALMVLVRGSVAKKLVIICLVSMILIPFFLPESIKTRFEQSIDQNGAVDESGQGRLFYWKVAFEIAKKYPFGVGTGLIRSAMQRYTGAVDDITGTGKYVDPHNGFLYVLCENGVIGLGVFVWLLLSMLKSAREIYMNTAVPLIYRTYALGMVGLFGAFIVCNMFYANFFKSLVMGTICIHFGMLALIKVDCKRILDTPCAKQRDKTRRIVA